MDDVIGGIRQSITRRNRVEETSGIEVSVKTPEKPRGWCETSGIEVITPGRYQDSLPSDSRSCSDPMYKSISGWIISQKKWIDTPRMDHLAKAVD